MHMRSLLSILLLLMFTSALAGKLEEGAAAYRTGNYEQAFKLWRPLADRGNADAQYNLGLLYMNGQGVNKNDRQALFLFLDAAKQGHVEAQYNAGYMFAILLGNMFTPILDYAVKEQKKKKRPPPRRKRQRHER